jgi:predicted XRE-type DNA-binding protein
MKLLPFFNKKNVSMENTLKKIDKKMINQSEIARRLGISQAYVNLILSGQKKSKKYLKLIAMEINKIKNVA